MQKAYGKPPIKKGVSFDSFATLISLTKLNSATAHSKQSTNVRIQTIRAAIENDVDPTAARSRNDAVLEA